MTKSVSLSASASYFIEDDMTSRVACSALILASVGSVAAFAQWTMRRAAIVFPDETRVQVEVADTEELRQRGLMFRKSLAPNEGMIFVFDRPGHYPFWMKNTLIPLDMLWLDTSSRIVAIADSVPPCQADPCPTFPPPEPAGPASFVVELVAGFAKAHKLKAGDLLKVSGLQPK